MIFTVVSHNASGVRNAWKMRNVDKDKWYVLYARSAEEKEAWMSAFQQERLRVVEDEKKGHYGDNKDENRCLIVCHVQGLL